MENVISKSAGVRRFGSAALDLAYVAAGRFDGFWETNLNPWDIAAGIVLIKEAGGIMNNMDLNRKDNIDIKTSSSSINEKMLEKLKNF